MVDSFLDLMVISTNLLIDYICIVLLVQEVRKHREDIPDTPW